MYRFPDTAFAATAERQTRMPWRVPRPLSLIEQRVVLLSRRDPAEPGRLGKFRTRIAALLFGKRPVNRLADPRLEALRRFAVALRIGDGRAPRAALEEFRAAGFADEQAHAVYAICRERDAKRRERPARMRRLALGAAIWAGVLPPVALGLSDYMDDEMFGLFGSTILMAALLPVVARIR